MPLFALFQGNIKRKFKKTKQPENGKNTKKGKERGNKKEKKKEKNKQKTTKLTK